MSSEVAERAAMQAQLDRIEEQQRLMAENNKKARMPAPSWGKARQTVESYGGGDPRAEVGKFKSFGHFMTEVAHAGNGWKEAPLFREYFQKAGEWIAKGYQGGLTKAGPPSGLNETTVADGGVLIPPQYIQQLLMRVYDNDLLSRTTLFPMHGKQLKIPAIAEVSRADGSRFGGIQAYWEGEGPPAPSETKQQFHEVSLDLNKLFLLVKCTEELLSDSPVALETYINNLAGQELTFKVGNSILNGTGNKQPLGILNSGALITVNKRTGQAAGSLLTENVTDMWARMWIGSRPNAVWLVNQDVEPQLLLMTLGVGTGGVVTYMPPGGLSGAPYGTLFGRPVIVTEFNPSLGTAGDVILADLSQILSGTRGGMQTAASMHVYFTTQEMSFRFTLRLDARCWWLSPLTPFQGTNTKSPIIALQTRS